MMCANKAFAIESESDKGIYKLLSIQKCPNHDDYQMKMECNMRKHNRTDDSLMCMLDFAKDMTEMNSAVMNMWEHTSNGNKHFYELRDNSMCAFLEKFFRGNLESLLANYNRPLPVCPIPKGVHKMAEPFVIDYEKMPKDGMPGTYDAEACVTEGDVVLGCICLTIEYKKKND
ncbi:hypothetical protein evm_002948 [Chilo suppressalis]|nr:hypothetical protein evm_002948 [Chilo suppressalis]